MATHSSTLAWEIPWTEEHARLQPMGSQRVGQDWATSLSLFTFMHWRRTWQPTPVFLPGESQGRGSLGGCHLWGHTESDTTEVTQQQQQSFTAFHYSNKCKCPFAKFFVELFLDFFGSNSSFLNQICLLSFLISLLQLLCYTMIFLWY